MKVKDAFQNFGKWADKNSPAILLVVGITGFVATTVLAVKETPKAVKKIEESEKELDCIREAIEDCTDEEEDLKKTYKKEKVNLYLNTAKDMAILYGPAALLAVSSTLCLVKSHKIESGRLTAVTTAYQISEVARKEYKDKVLEVLGEKKEHEIRDAINKDRVKNDPPDKESDVYNSTQDTLCYDSMSGRYFRSNKTRLEQAANKLNRRLMNEMYISLNEFYDEVNLDHIRLGDELGWNIDYSDIDLYLTSMLSDEGVPVLVLDYRIAPRYDFRNLH